MGSLSHFITMAQLSSRPLDVGVSSPALEHWIKLELRSRYNQALSEAVPTELMALASLIPRQGGSAPVDARTS